MMTNTAVDLHGFQGSMHLNETGQTTSMRIAPFVYIGPSKVQQILPFMKCRDYMNDVLWAYEEKRACAQYGMECDPTEWDLPMNKSQLLVRMSETDLKAFKGGLPLLRTYLKQYNIAPTTCRKVKDNSNILLLSGSGQWMRGTVLCSIYTLLLRCLQYYDGEASMEDLIEKVRGAEGTDAQLLQAVVKGAGPHFIHGLLSKRSTIFKKKYGVLGNILKYKYKLYDEDQPVDGLEAGIERWEIPSEEILRIEEVHDMGGIQTMAKAVGVGKDYPDKLEQYKVGASWVREYLALIE